MKKCIIFGQSENLANLFDLIHANGGKVYKIYQNMPIEDWTVIGAGSLVNKDMPGGVVAYGAPAKVIWENHEVDF